MQSITSPTGECFNFHVLVLIMYIRYLKQLPSMFIFWHIKLKIHIQKTKFTAHNLTFHGVLFSWNTGKAYAVFLLYLKRKHSQTFNNGSCKKHCLQCVFYLYNLLWLTFFIPCDERKALIFFIKMYR